MYNAYPLWIIGSVFLKFEETQAEGILSIVHMADSGSSVLYHMLGLIFKTVACLIPAGALSCLRGYSLCCRAFLLLHLENITLLMLLLLGKMTYFSSRFISLASFAYRFELSDIDVGIL